MLADERPLHKVRITKSFYFGQHEVTIAQFRAFVDSGYKPESIADGTGGYGYDPKRKVLSDKGEAFAGRDPKYSWRNPGFKQTDDHPVTNVTWNDAQAMCKWLSRKEGKKYRLPTEAEWEYACRAGSKTRFSFGDADADLGAYAWYTANSADRTTGVKSTHPAGLKKPNAWGLYDMHGNVWEWCSDWYAADYGPESQTDPAGPAKGAIRVLRGGSWNYCSWGCRLAGRGRIGPDGQYDVNGGGFRVVVAEKD